MFEIESGADGEILLRGRFDATQVEKASAVLLGLERSCTVDFSGLDYIASAGLGVLLAAQKRLRERGCALRLARPSNHIRDVLHFSGFDHVFEIE
jgi:anti-sigma B factor antagonist